MPNFNNIAKLWDIYKYPWIPNKENCDIINKSIGSDKKSILILGSTKEFRQIFKTHDLTICDLSSEMIESNNVGNINEKVLKLNWFSLKKGNYSFILGDLVTLMLDYENKLKLLEVLLKNLECDGKIILRIVVKNDSLEIKDINKIFLKLSEFKNLNEFFNYITFELVNAFGLKGDEISKIIYEYSINLGKKYTEYFLNMTPYNTSTNYCLSESQFEKLTNKYYIDVISVNNFLYVKEYLLVIKK